MLAIKGSRPGASRVGGPLIRRCTRHGSGWPQPYYYMPDSRSPAAARPQQQQQRRHFSPTTASFRQYEQHTDSEAGNNGGGASQGQTGGGNGGSNADPSLFAKMLESAATTLASVVVLGAGFAAAGYVYHKSYKALQLKKIENAFKPGDPVLVLAAVAKSLPDEEDSEHWIQRAEQSKIDAIVTGNSRGHYHLIMGEKGSGKSSMLLEAMRKIDGDGCAMFEAHADLEIFRIRLGKALDYEFRKFPFHICSFLNVRA